MLYNKLGPIPSWMIESPRKDLERIFDKSANDQKKKICMNNLSKREDVEESVEKLETLKVIK